MSFGHRFSGLRCPSRCLVIRSLQQLVVKGQSSLPLAYSIFTFQNSWVLLEDDSTYQRWEGNGKLGSRGTSMPHGLIKYVSAIVKFCLGSHSIYESSWANSNSGSVIGRHPVSSTNFVQQCIPAIKRTNRQFALNRPPLNRTTSDFLADLIVSHLKLRLSFTISS